jgi:hypothetical protein
MRAAVVGEELRGEEFLFLREIIKRHRKVTGTPFCACFSAALHAETMVARRPP